MFPFMSGKPREWRVLRVQRRDIVKAKGLHAEYKARKKAGLLKAVMSDKLKR